MYIIPKAKLCLLAGDAFICHKQLGLCVGFQEARTNQPPQPEWRKEVARKLLDVMEISEKDPQAARAFNENPHLIGQLLFEESESPELSRPWEGSR